MRPAMGGAERDVGAGAEPGEQGGQRRLQDHEQRGAVGAGQPPQLRVQGRRDGEVERWPPAIARACAGAGRSVGSGSSRAGRPGCRVQ